MARGLPVALFIACTVALGACGSSPSAPSQTPGFTAMPAGAWSGSTSIGSCAPATGTPPGVTLDICVTAGTIPISLQLQQTGESITGEIGYQGLRFPVSGRLTGTVVRLDGGLGAALADPAAPQVEIRGWQTRFLGAHEMSGTFTLVITRAGAGAPEATLDIQVTRLVRSGPA